MDEDNYDNYDNLNDVSDVDFILALINEKKKWGYTFPGEVATRIEYDYGSGMDGIIQALYNLILGTAEER